MSISYHVSFSLPFYSLLICFKSFHPSTTPNHTYKPLLNKLELAVSNPQDAHSVDRGARLEITPFLAHSSFYLDMCWVGMILRFLRTALRWVGTSGFVADGWMEGGGGDIFLGGFCGGRVRVRGDGWGRGGRGLGGGLGA